jgi:tetratricopeptide (TPR) repeat protein
LDEGRHELAAQLVMRHLRQHPGEPRGLALLGAVAMKAGALRQAENFLRQAMARGQDDAEARRLLGSCLHQQERLKEALHIFGEILPQDSDPHIRGTVALILDKLGRVEEARQIWEPLVQEHPEKPAHWVGYGHNLRGAGRTDEAIRAYRRAIAIEPDHGEAWWGIASIKKNVFDDEDVTAMETALRMAIDVRHIAPLHFALGRAWHLRKQYKKAFDHFAEANRLWAETINYDPDELTEEIHEAAGRFDRNYFEGLTLGGDPSEAPIFIVSLPRSGSTLLEQMLGSHADIEALGELPYIPSLLRAVMEKATSRTRVTVPQALEQLSPEERTSLGEEYLRRSALHRQSSKRRFTDKLPHNWNNVIFIRHILPNARFVDIRRDPVACCFANFSHSFTRAHASSFTLTDIGRAYVDYLRLMDHLDRAAPGLVHHLRYEELIEFPERELRHVMDYLGLPWDEDCLRFYESKRTVRTPSAEQVRRPLNREGIGTWKPYADWLGPLRRVLGPLADAETADA